MTEVQRNLNSSPPRDVGPSELVAANWITINFGLLVPAIRENISKAKSEEIKKAKEGIRASSPERFDDELRLPEEMPICTFWTNWSIANPLPTGFGIVEGSVLIEEKVYLDHEYQTRRADHQYLEALDGSETIIDHCAAQFHKRVSVDVPKGERLAVLKARAGNLTKTFTNEGGESHTFLIGTRAEIAARLRLKYDTVPRYES